MEDTAANKRIRIELACPQTIDQLKMTMPLAPHEVNFEVQNNGKGVYFVAWCDNDPVGYSLIRWGEKSTIESLEIQEDFEQREKLGNQLLEFAEKITQKKGCNAIEIAVLLTNTQAITFYMGLGYLPNRCMKSDTDQSKWCVFLEKAFN